MKIKIKLTKSEMRVVSDIIQDLPPAANYDKYDTVILKELLQTILKRVQKKLVDIEFAPDRNSKKYALSFSRAEAAAFCKIFLPVFRTYNGYLLAIFQSIITQFDQKLT